MPTHPLHNPTEHTRKQVTLACAAHMSHERIARVLGITRWTLERCYREILDTAAAKVEIAVTGVILEKATMDKDLEAAKWYSSRRMGWSDRTELSLEQPSRPVIFNIDFSDGGPGEAPKRLPAPEAEDTEATLVTVNDEG